MVRLTHTVSYMTSPRFNGLDLLYPNRYDGELELHVTEDECVLVSFTHFYLESRATRPSIAQVRYCKSDHKLHFVHAECAVTLNCK